RRTIYSRSRREHSDDLERFVAAEENLPAHDRRIAAVASHPITVTDDRNGAMSRNSLLRREQPSALGRDAEQREETGTRVQRRHPLRGMLTVTRNRQHVGVVQAQILEGRAVLLVVEELCARDREH